jgi:hypothetical protein
LEEQSHVVFLTALKSELALNMFYVDLILQYAPFFAASLLDWSLISLVNMIIFFAIRFVDPRRGMTTLSVY